MVTGGASIPNWARLRSVARDMRAAVSVRRGVQALNQHIHLRLQGGQALAGVIEQGALHLELLAARQSDLLTQSLHRNGAKTVQLARETTQPLQRRGGDGICHLFTP
jgi:hypothetical protein